MAAVETKVPGYFTERLQPVEDDKDGFGTHNLVLKVSERTHATRRPPPPPSHFARYGCCGGYGRVAPCAEKRPFPLLTRVVRACVCCGRPVGHICSRKSSRTRSARRA
jgi:hypothetical protein